jgi:hypothetical protein
MNPNKGALTMADEKQGYSGTQQDQQSDKQQKNQQNQPDTFKKNPSQGTGQGQENDDKHNQEQGGQRRAS